MKLDAFLEKSNLTHADFAERIGVSQASVTRYVQGRRMPRPDQLQRIREATNGAVQPNDFLPSADASKRRRSA